MNTSRIYAAPEHKRSSAVRRALLQIALVACVTRLASIAPADPVPAQLLSERDPSAVIPAGGNGDSVGASISPDGRFVVFTSAAGDLAPGDNRLFNTDVFLRNRASNMTTLVSVNLTGTGGGNSYSMFGQVSTNGRYVLFESDATNLVASDINGSADIFLRDMQAETTTLVSKTISGGSGFGRSYDAVMTPDGRYVAFVSSVANLVAGDANNIPDVFVRDMVANTNILVSVGATRLGTAMATPQITPDARYVAFFSSATGMVASAGTSTNGNVYVRDLLNGTTTWASTDGQSIVLSILGPAGAAKAMFRHPSVSEDGRYVAFMGGGTNGTRQSIVLMFDQVAGTTTIIATNTVGALPSDDNRYGPEMTPDARFVAYVKEEADGTNSNVYAWDALAGTNILVSGDSSGVPANAVSHSPVLSTNGQFVAFLSNASNLVATAVSPGFHVYVRDIQSGTTQLMDADTNGVGSVDVGGTYPSVSGNGQFVLFNAPDSQLVGSDNNKSQDVFLRDTFAGTNELISQRSAVVPATGYNMTRMSSYSISADGRWVAFESYANDLVPDDTNDWCDIFVRDLWTGQTIRASSDIAIVSNVIPYACCPAISGDGRYVAYVRPLYNGQPLTQYPANMTALNIFRYDRETGSNALVTVGINGTGSATIDCFSPVISHDGRFIAFVSPSTNLTPFSPTSIMPGTLWRDMNAPAPVVIGSGATIPSSFSPSMSADGRFVAYQTNTQFRVRDMQLGTIIYTNSATVTSAAISPDGRRVLYNLVGTVRVDGINPRTNLMSFNNTLPLVQSSRQWSSDGRYVVFVGLTNLPSAKSQVYLCDLATSNITLVSFNAMTLGAPNAPSDMPTISGDGRFVAYRSYATNVVVGDGNPSPKIFLFDRLSGTNSILSAAQSDSEPFPWISAPAISAGAENVAFVSIGSDLVVPDVNRVTDAFAVRVLIRMQISPDASPGRTTTLTWQTVPQRNYAVQYRDELSDPQWHDLPATVSIVGNQGSVTVTTEQPNRFYQIVETE